MEQPLILSFDCGSQSVRGLIFDKDGQLLAKKQVSYQPYISLQPGWAERDADFYYERICEASRGLKAEAPELFARVAACTLTTMRDTAVALDGDLKPLRPCILWMDQRKAACPEPFPIHCEAAFLVSGMKDCVEASRRASMSNWIRENQPEIWEKTYKYVMLSTYLSYRMTGNLSDSNANQVGHFPFAYKKKRWMHKANIKTPVFNIELDKLCPLIQPGEIQGYITRETSELSGLPQGLPFIAAGSDKGCETLGSGCVDGRLASISFGTTSTVQLVTKKYVEPQPFLPAYPSLVPDMYNPEIQIYRGFWMISWFTKEFAGMEQELAREKGVPVEAILDQRLQEIPPGSEGLLLQPYWGGGLRNPEALGAVLGFTETHTRAHLYRAIIEGINYALRDGLETLCRRANQPVEAITVSGGGSQSDVVCQMTADQFGQKVLRAQTYETAGLGAAMVAFVGMGEYATEKEAVAHMVRHTSEFNPTLEGHRIYDRLYREVYKEIYGKVRPLYQRIRKIYADDLKHKL